MCAQDLSKAQGVNSPVAGSLRVRQPCEDRDKRQEMVNKVGTNSGLTRSSKGEVTMKRSQWRVGSKPRVNTRDRVVKSKANVNCCVKRQSRQTKDSSSNNDNKLRRLNESSVTVNLTSFKQKMTIQTTCLH